MEKLWSEVPGARIRIENQTWGEFELKIDETCRSNERGVMLYRVRWTERGWNETENRPEDIPAVSPSFESLREAILFAEGWAKGWDQGFDDGRM